MRVSHGSSSELRPVRLVQRGNNLEFGEALSPSPLDLSWFDWARSIALILDWPYWGYRHALSSLPPHLTSDRDCSVAPGLK